MPYKEIRKLNPPALPAQRALLHRASQSLTCIDIRIDSDLIFPLVVRGLCSATTRGGELLPVLGSH